MPATKYATSPSNRQRLVPQAGLIAALVTILSVAHAQETSDNAVRTRIDATRRAMRDAALQQRQQPDPALGEGVTTDFNCPTHPFRYLRDEVAYTPPPNLPMDILGCRVTVTAALGFWDHSGNDVNSPMVLRGRILRSDDQGQTWHASDRGLPAPRFIDQSANGAIAAEWPVVQDMVVSKQDPNIMYIGTKLIQSVPTTPQVGNGLFKSVDGGRSWTAINSGLPRQGESRATVWDTSDLLLHPRDHRHVLVVLAETSSHPGAMHLYRSTDGGSRWSQVQFGNLPNTDIQRILLLSESEQLQASLVTQDNSVYRYESRDFGLTWTVLTN